MKEDLTEEQLEARVDAFIKHDARGGCPACYQFVPFQDMLEEYPDDHPCMRCGWGYWKFKRRQKKVI